MVRPDRHWCCAEVWRKGLHSYDQGEGLLLDRIVIPLGGSKLAAQVADWMLHSIHNLYQNCTQTSLGSIYRYRKRQIPDGPPYVTISTLYRGRALICVTNGA